MRNAECGTLLMCRAGRGLDYLSFPTELVEHKARFRPLAAKSVIGDRGLPCSAGPFLTGLAQEIESALNGAEDAPQMKLNELADRSACRRPRSAARSTVIRRSARRRASASSTPRAATTIARMPARSRLATGRAGAIGAVLQTDRNLLLRPALRRIPRRPRRAAGRGRDRHRAQPDARATTSAGSYRRIAAGTRVDAVVLSSPPIAGRAGRSCSPTSACRSSCTDAPQRRAARLARHRQRGCVPACDQPSARSRPYAHRPDQRPKRFTYAAHRERGFRDALPARGLAVDERLIADGAMTDEIGYPLRRALPRRDAAADRASWSSSMMMALGAFRAMRAAGLELGKDVSMIAHDDVFPFLNADRMVPPMSTTRSSIRAAGTRVAELTHGASRRRAARDDPRTVAGRPGHPRLDRTGAGLT